MPDTICQWYMTKISIIFVVESNMAAHACFFFIEAHSSQDFSGREIGLAIETEMNIYRKQW